MKVINDKILVLPDPVEEVSKGGIILPETMAREKPMQGTVKAVGPGRLKDSGERSEMTIKEGDVVCYSKFTGTELTVDGINYVVMREDDIHLVFSHA